MIEAGFLILEHSSLKAVKQKKHEKKLEILAFKPLLQDIQLRNLASERCSEACSNIIFTVEAYRNGVKLNYVPPLWF